MKDDWKVSCTLDFKTSRINQTSVTTYGYCVYKSHEMSYKFKLYELYKPMACLIITSTKKTEEKHDGPKIFRQLRGEDRFQAFKHLKHINPRGFQLQELVSANRELAQDGNMQEVRNLNTYQRIKTDYYRRDDKKIKSRDIVDLVGKGEEEKNKVDKYIQVVQTKPLSVIMFSDEQFDILEDDIDFIYMDATGSVVRKPLNVN